MKNIFIASALGLALPLSAAMAEQNSDYQEALNSLNASIASAELSIALANASEAIHEVNGQSAVNLLSASIADAEVSISLANANDAIFAVEQQAAIDGLAALIADAELSIALSEAKDTINGVSDDTMLAELDQLLAAGQHEGEAEQLIMATVAERPMLASSVQAMALDSGFNEALVANAIIGGLSTAEATAAGK